MTRFDPTDSERNGIVTGVRRDGSPATTTWDGRSCDRYESLTACRAASIVDFPATVPKSQPLPGTNTRR